MSEPSVRSNKVLEFRGIPACLRLLRCVCMLWYRSFVNLDSLCREGFALKSPQEDENQDVKKLISSKQQEIGPWNNK